MLQNIKEKLNSLKLYGMAEGVEEQIRTPLLTSLILQNASLFW